MHQTNSFFARFCKDPLWNMTMSSISTLVNVKIVCPQVWLGAFRFVGFRHQADAMDLMTYDCLSLALIPLHPF